VGDFGQFNFPFHDMLQTSGDCTIRICADFQDPVELIPLFIQEWENGYKNCIGHKGNKQRKQIYEIFMDMLL
jgi:hypothetical protein